MRFPLRLPARITKRLPKKIPGIRFPKIRFPVLTAGEKTALTALVLVLGAGAALRAWERSGVSLGPVDDWESLRSMLIRARQEHAKAGGGGYACAEEAPAGFHAADGSVGRHAKSWPPAPPRRRNQGAGEKPRPRARWT
jgi:hypothetical protein